MYRIIIETKNNVRYYAETNSEEASEFSDDLKTYENDEFIDLHCNRTKRVYQIRRGDISVASIKSIGEESQ